MPYGRVFADPNGVSFRVLLVFLEVALRRAGAEVTADEIRALPVDDPLFQRTGDITAAALSGEGASPFSSTASTPSGGPTGGEGGT